MLTKYFETHVQNSWRLPNYSRSIRSENLKALARRWHIARSTELIDPRVIARWFPGQRNLLEMLAVISEEEVVRIADCNSPLFSLMIHDSLQPGTSACLVQPGEFEAANRHEAFLALTVRLDSIRTAMDHACVQFDLTSSEANHIGRYEPHELWDISANPSLVMLPAASDQYFMAAATRDMTSSQRTLYMTMSKRSKNSVH